MNAHAPLAELFPPYHNKGNTLFNAKGQAVGMAVDICHANAFVVALNRYCLDHPTRVTDIALMDQLRACFAADKDSAKHNRVFGKATDYTASGRAQVRKRVTAKLGKPRKQAPKRRGK